MIRNPVTPEGYVALEARLRQLREVERPKIVRDIEEARAHGDLSENSEYEDAKDRQGHCEGMIASIEGRLASAEVIDVTRLPPDDRVVFGARVIIENSAGEQRTWRIVGEDQADVDLSMISFSSPLGKALIGKRAGEETVVQAPAGNQTWEIIEVTYKVADGPGATAALRRSS